MADKSKNKQPLDADARRFIWRFLRNWARPQWRPIAFALVATILAAGSTALYPVLIQHAVEMFQARDMRVVWLIPLAAVAITALRGGSLYGQAVFMNQAVYRVVTELRASLFDQILKADMARIGQEGTGRLMSRVQTDTSIAANALQRGVFSVRDSLTIFGLVGAMLYLDWQLSLIVLIIYPIAALPIIRIGERLRKISKNTQEHTGDVMALLGESIAGARMVKTFGLEEYERNRARQVFEKTFRLGVKQAEGRARLDPTLEVLGGVAVGGVFAFGGWRVASGAGTLGDFTGFVSALLMAAQPVRALGSLNNALQEGIAALQRIFSFIDEKPEIVDAPDAKPLDLTQGRVALEHVSFAYGDEGHVLRDINLTVGSGQTVALVGRSGAGKSTVFNLIPRLFDASEGKVLIDGQDVRHATLESVRSAVAVVSQDVVLFNDTVRANIAFGKLDATDEEIEAAARSAAAHDFIMRLPEGYNTMVGDRGLRLSGGERQRISIARAMLKDAPILLLDEATNALDAESERIVQDALERLSKGRTALVIAHRLSTVQSADQICVMEAGEIIERGTHTELMAENGAYAKLSKLQFQSPSSEEEDGEEQMSGTPEPSAPQSA